MNKTQTKKINNTFIIFLMLTSLILLATIFILPKDVAYAKEESLGEVTWTDLNVDGYGWYNQPKNISLEVIRVRKDVYKITGYMDSKGRGTGERSFTVYVNDTAVFNENKKQGLDKRLTIDTGEFSHNDQDGFSIYCHNHTIWGVSQPQSSTEEKYIGAYDNSNPTIIVTCDDYSSGTSFSTNKPFTISADDDRTATLQKWNGSDYIDYNGAFESKGSTPAGTYWFRSRDQSYNYSAEYKVEYSTTRPTGTLIGVSNGGITNKNVSFTWSDRDATATLNDNPYTSGNLITNNGLYTLVLSDKTMGASNNSTTYTFRIDKDVPTGVLLGVSNGGITNKNVSFSWDDDATATLNGVAYKPNTLITNEGNYTIVLTDKATNSSKYTFTIDKTAPTGTLSGVTNGGITNKDVSFSWDDDATATLGDAPYISGTTITANGLYSIILTDRAGNSTTYIFEIDKKIPLGKLNGVDNGSATNRNVTFIWDDDATATLNGVKYEPNTIINNEGNYTIVLTDRAGNSSQYTFTIDRTAPTGTLSNVTNGKITNKDVSFTWSDSRASATLDGSNYSKNQTISLEGKHTIILTDTAGNSSRYTFTIDKTAPKGTLIGVSNGGITNKNVYFTWDDDATATLDTIGYEHNSLINKEGKHTIILTDTAGNSSRYTFEIDKTAPTGTLSGVTNGGTTGQDVSFSWSDDGATATLNNNLYTKNTKIVGTIDTKITHTIILTDRAGNSTTYTFTINKIRPEGVLRGVSNGGITNKNVSFSWNDDATATLNNKPYEKNYNIIAQNTYTIILTNKYGNSSRYTFEIDKTAPTGILSNVTNGGITNKNVSFTWSDSRASATLDGVRYSNRSSITNEGKHTILLVDTAGNSTTYTFEIDKTAPTGTLNGVENGGITNKDVSFSWFDTKSKATLNGEIYDSSQLISLSDNKKEMYTIILTDTAGNSSTYTFTIDKEKPTIIFKDVNENILEVHPNKKFYHKNSIIFENENNYEIKINGEIIKNNMLISKPNSTIEYSIRVSDTLENYNNYVIVIDTEAPINNFNQAVKDGKSYINHWWETYEYELVGTAYQQKNKYSFASYEQARTYAMARENSIKESGQYQGGKQIYCNYAQQYVDADENLASHIGHTYYIYKSINNSGKLIAYFNLNNLQEAINKYSLNSISEKTIPNVPPTGYENELIYTNYIFISNSNYSLKYNNSATCSLLINGAVASYDTILTEGVNNIVETDKAGNSTSFVILIDNSAPKAVITDTSGNGSSYSNPVAWIDNLANAFNNQSEIRFAREFRLSINDNLDTNSILKITSETGIITYLFMEENNNYYNFLDSGIYTVEWFDKSYNKKLVKLFLSLDTPTGNIVEIKNDMDKIQSFDFVLDKVLNYNSIIDMKVEYSASGKTGSFSALSSETKPAFTFSASNSKYSFFENGYYKFTIYDNFGRTIPIEKVYHLQKNAPIGFLNDINGNFLANNSVINKGVKLIWKEQAEATLDGEPYEKGTIITSVGKHTFILTDKGDNKSIYEVEIDTTPLVFTLENVKINGTTNKLVTIKWDKEAEPNALAYVKDEQGVYQVCNNGTIFDKERKYEIMVFDRAGNKTEFYFTIDKTPPTILIQYLNGQLIPNGSLINKNFKFTWGGERISNAWVNGEPYTENQPLSSDGIYNLTIEDKLGNKAYANVTLDKTLHQGTLINVVNGGITNKDVMFTWNDSDAIATLNGKPYRKNDVITIAENEEEKFTILLQDNAGNKLEYSFTISHLNPVIDLQNVKNGEKTKYSVTASWLKDYIDVTLDNKPYQKGALIKDEGIHTLIATDTRTSNSSTYTFEIDKTAPTGTLSGVENGGYTNQNVTFTWSEDGAIATLDGNEYEKNAPIFDNGKHSIYLFDSVNNKSIEYLFTIDKTAPTGTLNGVSNGGITSSFVTFSWSEIKATATLDNKPYENGSSINENGIHTIILTDRAGNSSTYEFVIDTSKPYATFMKGSETISVEYYYNETINIVFNGDFTATLNNEEYTSATPISEEGIYKLILANKLNTKTTYQFIIDKTAPTGDFRGIDINKGITNKNVYFSWSEGSAFATLDNEEYISNTSISTIGNHTIILTDKAGNSSRYTFTIDRTIPVGILSGVENGGITNKDVSFSWDSEATAKLNNEPYISDTSITQNGKYTIVLTSSAGTETIYTFEIDKTAPVGTLYNVSNKGFTNKNVFFTWDDSDAKATLNEQPYESNSVINAIENSQQEYTIVLTDKAGNSTTYTFTINTLIPTGILTGVENGGVTNQNVSLHSYSKNVTATLDDNPYILDTPITSEGIHIIILTDISGNSNIYKFEIDKTAPTGTLNGVENGGITNKNVSFSWDEDDATATLDNLFYANNSSIICLENENVLHTIVLIDKAGNSSTYTFIHYSYLPEAYIEGINENQKSNKSINITFNSEFTGTLNGSPYISNTEITDEGTYTFIVTNKLDISKTYTFEIDKTAPIIKIYNKLDIIIEKNITNIPFSIKINEKGTIVCNSSYYDNNLIKKDGIYNIVATDEAGNQSVLSVELNLSVPTGIFSETIIDNEVGNDVSFIFNEDYTATLDGEVYISDTIIKSSVNSKDKHTIILTNLYGTSNTYEFTINTIKPTAKFIGINIEKGITNKNVSCSWDNAGYYAILNDEKNYESNTLIICDDNTTAKYSLVIYNKLGNSTTYTFEIDKSAPIGTLNGVINGGTTNKDVSFSWDEEELTAILDGNEYTSGSTITGIKNNKKTHSIVLTDKAGNSSTYTFVIDRRKPTLSSNIMESPKINTNDITIKFDDNMYSATLNGVSIENKHCINLTGDYVLILSDELGNSTTYNFILDKTTMELPISINGEEKTLTSSFVTENSVVLNSDLQIYVNDELVEKGFTLDKVGEYVVKLVSSKGLEEKFTITIKAPDTTQQTYNTILTIIIILISIAIFVTIIIYIVKITKRNQKRII